MKEKGEMDHYIGVATTGNEPAGYDVLKVEAGTWAVFESIGPFPETFRMYGEGYTRSGFRLQDMKWLKAPKFCGTKVRILQIQNIEAKSGFR